MLNGKLLRLLGSLYGIIYLKKRTHLYKYDGPIVAESDFLDVVVGHKIVMHLYSHSFLSLWHLNSLLLKQYSYISSLYPCLQKCLATCKCSFLSFKVWWLDLLLALFSVLYRQHKGPHNRTLVHQVHNIRCTTCECSWPLTALLGVQEVAQSQWDGCCRSCISLYPLYVYLPNYFKNEEDVFINCWRFSVYLLFLIHELCCFDSVSTWST